MTKFLRCSYAAVLLTLLTAGLWPLNFFPKNQVEWLKDEDGLRFGGRSRTRIFTD